MIDLETLGVGPTAAVLSVGAVVFDGEHFIDTFSMNVDIESCLDADLHVNHSTLMWWLQQGEDARRSIYDEDAHSLYSVLTQFSSFFTQAEATMVWSNGASFDIPIMEHCFRRVMLSDPPWDHWNTRCYRTMKNIYKDVPKPKNELAHNALEDAKAQAAHLMLILKNNGYRA